MKKQEELKSLPIGAVKSNMGHCESASGMASLIKVIISYENQCIPKNLNLKQLKHSIVEYCPPLHPINENYNYDPGN